MLIFIVSCYIVCVHRLFVYVDGSLYGLALETSRFDEGL